MAVRTLFKLTSNLDPCLFFSGVATLALSGLPPTDDTLCLSNKIRTGPAGAGWSRPGFVASGRCGIARKIVLMDRVW